MMAKHKESKEVLANKRERERLRYQKIKNNPDLYAKYKKNNNTKYERRKAQKKIVRINEMTFHQQTMQRQKWREEGKRRYQRINGRKGKERQLLTMENSPQECGIESVHLVEASEGKENEIMNFDIIFLPEPVNDAVVKTEPIYDSIDSCHTSHDAVVVKDELLVEENIAKPKPKRKKELLAIKRERERLRYQKIKNDPELYAEYQRNNNMKYENRKTQKKIVHISEMTTRQQKMQRQKWREEGKRRYQRIKEIKGKEKQLIIENIPQDGIETVQLDAPGLENVIVKEAFCDATGSCDAAYDAVVKVELCEESKPKSKTKQELLPIKRERERLRYQKIKNNSELYAEYQRNQNMKYEKRKVQKKILNISEMTTRQQKMQRKKWREEGKKRYQRIKDRKGKEKQLITENIPQDCIKTVQLDAQEGLENAIVKEAFCDDTGSSDATYDAVEMELCEENMSKPTSKIKEDLLAIKRKRETLRYQKIKNNPELYAEYQRNNNMKYQKRKGKEMTIHQQNLQRKKWREEGKRRYQSIKDRKRKDKQLITENIPQDKTVQLDTPKRLENVIVKETFCDATGSCDAIYDGVVKVELFEESMNKPKPKTKEELLAIKREWIRTVQLDAPGLENVIVKETFCDATGSCDAHYDAVVKKEPLCEDTGCADVKDTGSCASDDALTKLYENHEVKDEVVLGPESLQRPVVSAAPYVDKAIFTITRDAQGGLESPPTSNKPKLKKKHPCQTCGKEFKRAYHLKTHMLTHTGLKPFTCEICKKDFTVISNLKSHKRVHTGEKPFSCEICKMCFANSGSLKVHERIHTGLKPYCCEICKKVFRVPDTLKRHKRTHTGEKPYLCEICKKGFNDTGDLKKHKRTHSGEKPYSCDICNKKFAQLSNLRIHKRIHTGEKPYNCNVCEKKFSQLIHLKKHENIHTRDPISCKGD